MTRLLPIARRRFYSATAAFLALAILAGPALAQDKGATKLTLAELINVGLERQPALSAARASLAATQSGYNGVSSLGLGARLLSRDIPVRQQQACIGISIAAAALEQAEWDTRYAIVRNYYSIIYARKQLVLVQDMKAELDDSIEKAIKLEKSGDPDIKITKIDINSLKLSLELLKSKEAEASVGIQRAHAALREALGVGLDFPLDIEGNEFPPLLKSLNKEELIAQALANRGEVAQASGAMQVTTLEIDAQARMRFAPRANTFAMGSDIHVQPVPQGVANGEYRPGAIGLEMPPMMVGKRKYRIARAEDLNARAYAVVEKTTNLVTLEVEAIYLKWMEAAQKVQNLEPTPKMAAEIYDQVKKSFDTGRTTGEQLLRARGMRTEVQASLNDAYYNHALALAALERATAGAFRITKLP